MGEDAAEAGRAAAPEQRNARNVWEPGLVPDLGLRQPLNSRLINDSYVEGFATDRYPVERNRVVIDNDLFLRTQIRVPAVRAEDGRNFTFRDRDFGRALRSDHLTFERWYAVSENPNEWLPDENGNGLNFEHFYRRDRLYPEHFTNGEGEGRYFLIRRDSLQRDLIDI